MNPQVMEHKWVEHVRAWQASGLTQKAYAQEHGLRAASLSYWVGRGRAASVKQAKPVPATVALAADGEHHPCPGGWQLAPPGGRARARGWPSCCGRSREPEQP